ncbi:choline/ethanolamine kinase--aminoglycoside phosphotransferase, partial [Thioclava sp. BHET1]
ENAYGVEITEFVEGRRTASNRDFLRPGVRFAVIDAYRKLHAAPALGLQKTVFDMIEEHLASIHVLGVELPPEAKRLLPYLTEAEAAIRESGIDLVPCFNDPMPGNFLFDAEDQLTLIDYEYASDNDRLYDLAAWSVEMFFSDAVVAEILTAYFGELRASDLARMSVYKMLAD